MFSGNITRRYIIPYNGPNDDKLPSEVMEMSEDDRAQWVEVWNSAFDSCREDGGEMDECEGAAFAQANGAISGKENSMNDNLLKRLLKGLERLIFEVEDEITQDRAMGLDRIFDRVWQGLMTHSEYVYLHGIYREDAGSLYAVVNIDGVLMRSDITIADDEVLLGQFVRVSEEFPEVQTMRSHTTIRRQKDGRYRWVSISATSVLNRSGEIDSRDLFDSFVAHAEASGKYPVRQFYHQGEVFRTGEADYLARDENLYITSGLYDDSELGRVEVKARQKDPAYWGDSIGYHPTAAPEMVTLAPNVTVPVYRAGVNHEISTLPEAEAANLMTNHTELMEVDRMLTGKSFEAFVKLFDDDEEAAKRWLEANAEGRNRTIEQAGMVTRSQNEDDTPEDDGEQPATPETPEPEVAEPAVIELDDEATAEIIRQLGEAEVITALTAQIASLTETIQTLQADLTKDRTQRASVEQATDSRLSALEADEVDKQRQWQEDLPRNSQVRVTYRPRVNRAPENEGEVDEAPANEKAKQVTNNIAGRY